MRHRNVGPYTFCIIHCAGTWTVIYLRSSIMLFILITGGGCDPLDGLFILGLLSHVYLLLDAHIGYGVAYQR